MSSTTYYNDTGLSIETKDGKTLVEQSREFSITIEASQSIKMEIHNEELKEALREALSEPQKIAEAPISNTIIKTRYFGWAWSGGIEWDRFARREERGVFYHPRGGSWVLIIGRTRLEFHRPHWLKQFRAKRAIETPSSS